MPRTGRIRLSGDMSRVKGVASSVKRVDDFIKGILETNPQYAGTTSTEKLKLDTLNKMAGPSEYGKMAPATEEIAARLPAVRQAFESIPNMSRKPDENALAVARQNVDELGTGTNPYAIKLGMLPTVNEADILELMKSENVDDAMRAAEQLRRQVANRQALYVPPTKLDEIPFYTPQAALNRVVAGELGIDPRVIATARALGSPMIGPTGDFSRMLSALGNVRREDLFNLSIPKNVPYSTFAEGIVTGLDDALKAGSFENKIRFIQNKVFNYMNSMNEADAPVLNDLINAKNVKELDNAINRAKTHFKSYTVDTMDLRGASGLLPRSIEELYGKPLKEVLLSASGKAAADTAGELRPAFQAATWFPSRILTSTTGKPIPASFKQLSTEDQRLLLKLLGNRDLVADISSTLPAISSSQRFAGQPNVNRTAAFGNLEDAIIKAITGGSK